MSAVVAPVRPRGRDRRRAPGTAPSTAPGTAPSTGLDTAPSTGQGAAPASDLLPCRSADPELWFAEQPALVQQAKELCVTCPVRQACLRAAVERREPWGVWGGEIFVDGVVVARKRGRGRPRKDGRPPGSEPR